MPRVLPGARWLLRGFDHQVLWDPAWKARRGNQAGRPLSRPVLIAQDGALGHVRPAEARRACRSRSASGGGRRGWRMPGASPRRVASLACWVPLRIPLRRSASLVLLAGVSVLLSYLTAINRSIYVIWGVGWSWFWSSLILFFATPLLLGSYLCRALRLAVVFHPRAKRALPWLIPVSLDAALAALDSPTAFFLSVALPLLGPPAIVFGRDRRRLPRAPSSYTIVCGVPSPAMAVRVLCLPPSTVMGRSLFGVKHWSPDGGWSVVGHRGSRAGEALSPTGARRLGAFSAGKARTAA